jgi:hypothetical protein
VTVGILKMHWLDHCQASVNLLYCTVGALKYGLVILVTGLSVALLLVS